MLNCYYMDIECGCSHEQVEKLKKILPTERLEQLNRLRNEKKAQKYLLSSVFLQYVLSDTLGILPQEISYIYGECGKPELLYNENYTGKKIDFNLSHSGKYAVLAVSDKPVGIDVEHLKKDRIAVAKRFFCKEEYEKIVNAPVSIKDTLFLEYWTMKEAYVKRTGQGLYTPLDSFEINRGEDGISSVNQEEIYFATFFLEKEMYCVSVCSEKKEELTILSKKTMQEIKLDFIEG